MSRLSLSIIAMVLVLLSYNFAEAADGDGKGVSVRRLVTAVDLLTEKNLPIYQPTISGISKNGFITATDLLQIKGLLAPPSTGVKQNDQKEEEDIWGVDVYMGC